MVGLDDTLSPRQGDCGTVQKGPGHFKEEGIEATLIDKLIRKAIATPSSECI